MNSTGNDRPTPAHLASHAGVNKSACPFVLVYWCVPKGLRNTKIILSAILQDYLTWLGAHVNVLEIKEGWPLSLSLSLPLSLYQWMLPVLMTSGLNTTIVLAGITGACASTVVLAYQYPGLIDAPITIETWLFKSLITGPVQSEAACWASRVWDGWGADGSWRGHGWTTEWQHKRIKRVGGVEENRTVANQWQFHKRFQFKV